MYRQLKSAPNQLTLLRLVFIPFIVMALIDGRFAIALTLFVLAGLTDGLDGLLARRMNQRTVLGQFLDPIADKLLLSTLFLVLSATHHIPWQITILVFSRDLAILLVAALLYLTTQLRDFSPTLYGKANTVAQIVTLLLVMVQALFPSRVLGALKEMGLWTVFALTLISALHYIFLVGRRLRNSPVATRQ